MVHIGGLLTCDIHGNLNGQIVHRPLLLEGPHEVSNSDKHLVLCFFFGLERQLHPILADP